MRMIDGAIQRGAALYNDGQAAACAAVYEVAASALLMYDDELPREAARMHDASDRAWAMRRGLDRAAMAVAGTSTRAEAVRDH